MNSRRKRQAKQPHDYITKTTSHAFPLFSGPSYAIDSGSSGSLLAFEHGYRMLRTGVVDGVVVAGCSLLLNPVLSVMMQKLNIVSPDGKSKPFDATSKSDARVVTEVVMEVMVVVVVVCVGTDLNSSGRKS